MKLHLYHTDISTEEIIRLYIKEKISIKAIGRKLNINHKTVRLRLTNAGVSIRKRGSRLFRVRRGAYTVPTEAFWSKVNKDGPVPSHCPELGPCWLWTGWCGEDGRGHFSYLDEDGKRVFVVAPRFAYQEEYGPFPESKPFACHKCDNPSCVRPTHLFAGSPKDNQQDACQKGRRPTGDRAGNALLNQKQARKIRELYASGKFSQQALGNRFGVSQHAISRIVRNISYTEKTECTKTIAA